MLEKEDEELKASGLIKRKRSGSFDSCIDMDLNMEEALLSDKSNSSDEEVEAPKKMKKRQLKGKKSFRPRGADFRERYEQEIDSNVMSIRFNVLNELSEVASGDPTLCSQCGAIFNKFSKLQKDQHPDEAAIPDEK